MRHRAAVPILVFLWMVAAPLTAGDEPYDGAHFKRVTLLVADMDRSLQIYRDILGFDFDGVSESAEESYSYPVFRIPPSAKIRFATLSAGTEQVRTLGLTEVSGIELPKPDIPLMSAAVIRVNDIDGTMTRIKALGLETTEPKIAGRPGEFSFKEQAFVDFDGHLIVLYQILEVVGD